MVRKTLILIGGLFLGCLMINALTWVVSGKWFTFVWWANLSFFVVSIVICRRFGITSASNEAYRQLEEWFASLFVRFARSRVINLTLYFAPNYFGWLIGTSALCLGLLVSGSFYRRREYFSSYIASFIAWIVWAVILMPILGLRKARIAHERQLAGQVIGFHNARLGRILLITGDVFEKSGCLIVPAMIYFVARVIFASSTSGDRYGAVIATISFFGIVSLGPMLHDAGYRLLAQPVLSPGEVKWDDGPVGLLLRSFADESESLGERNFLNRRMIEGVLMNAKLKLGWSGESIDWLTAVMPGEYLVSSGMKRVALRNDEWQQWISDAISKVDIIAVLVGDTGGLDWELSEIIGTSNIPKLRLIALPHHNLEVRKNIFERLGTASNNNLSMPKLPRLNQTIVAYWWEGGGWRNETLDFGRGFSGFLMRIYQASMTKW